MHKPLTSKLTSADFDSSFHLTRQRNRRWFVEVEVVGMRPLALTRWLTVRSLEWQSSFRLQLVRLSDNGPVLRPAGLWWQPVLFEVISGHFPYECSVCMYFLSIQQLGNLENTIHWCVVPLVFVIPKAAVRADVFWTQIHFSIILPIVVRQFGDFNYWRWGCAEWNGEEGFRRTLL